ncbi:hypothetical protein JKP88DRAFT_280754 [Tribonema minus]|uniref:Pentatricopeptide repeat-containing protein n=1 Tax=Tribonema minus TaxID=303371 RepID=A0A836CBI1_9STRA|nr:hypothetical protein JKP88DRAFT_280754 [Tribonema minus]
MRTVAAHNCVVHAHAAAGSAWDDVSEWLARMRQSARGDVSACGSHACASGGDDGMRRARVRQRGVMPNADTYTAALRAGVTPNADTYTAALRACARAGAVAPAAALLRRGPEAPRLDRAALLRGLAAHGHAAWVAQLRAALGDEVEDEIEVEEVEVDTPRGGDAGRGRTVVTAAAAAARSGKGGRCAAAAAAPPPLRRQRMDDFDNSDECIELLLMAQVRGADGDGSTR